MTSKNSGPGPRKGHRARMVKPKHHDTYHKKAKAGEALVCDRCGVVGHAGRWYWGTAPLAEARGGLCPACERIRDGYPAGTIRLRGALLSQADEIRHMIAKVEQAEKEEHPLERVMQIEESEEGMIVTTTGIHIARRIASKLERRFHEKAKVRYPAEQKLISVELRT